MFIRLAKFAAGEMKKFFLAQAGIPFNAAGELDFGLGELARRLREDAKTALNSLERSKKHPEREADSDIGWDPDLAIFVIETIDGELKKRGRRLPVRKYAEMVVLFYEFCQRTGQRDSEMVGRLLKIA